MHRFARIPGSVPEIQTDRLRMRAHEVLDLDECAAMWADPSVTRHIGRVPFTRDAVWSKILRYAGLWSLLGFGYWVLEERATGRFVGEAGFADFHRDISPPIDVPEIGWVLSPRAHGIGLATEAVKAALAWADEHVGTTAALIDPENVASLRVAAKCGYREHVRTTYKGEPVVVFRR